PQLKPARWARTLGDAARISTLHAVVIRNGIEILLASRPTRKPVEMLALLELEHELCVQVGIPISDHLAVGWLEDITGGGKTARIARQLLALQPEQTSAHCEAAIEALRNRIERAVRWQRVWSEGNSK